MEELGEAAGKKRRRMMWTVKWKKDECPSYTAHRDESRQLATVTTTA